MDTCLSIALSRIGIILHKKRGANALQVDAYGRTPFKVAMKAGHGEICALLERYGAAPRPSSPRSRHRLRQLTPVGATKASQHTLQHQRQQLPSWQAIHDQTRPLPGERDQGTDSGVSGLGGHIKMGSAAVTSGSTLMHQQHSSKQSTSVI